MCPKLNTYYEFAKFIGISNYDEESGYDPEKFIENYKESLFSIFGNKDDYKIFIRECFVISADDLANHLADLGFLRRQQDYTKKSTYSLVSQDRPDIYYS